MSITAGIVLLLPDPPVESMTLSQAADALHGHASALQRHDGPPSKGVPAPLLQHALARTLHQPASSVEVVWLDSSPSHPFVPSSDRKPGSEGLGNVPFVFKGNGLGIPTSEGVTLRMGQAQALQLTDTRFDGILLSLPQPPFAASMRDARGRWETVYPRQSFLGGWRLKVLIAMAVSLLLLAPLAWLFARRFTRPFRALADAIRQNRDVPMAEGPSELRDAAGAIVQLRSRLARDADERMRMLTAIAHDLRTPLTALKLRIESVAEPQRMRMAADADRMQAMIQEVLTFTRAAAAPRATVSVHSTVAEIIAALPPIDKKVTLSGGADISVTVVEAAFCRALENLAAIMHGFVGSFSVF